nr:MAG: capsid protein [Cressdnaviricota sp.]
MAYKRKRSYGGRASKRRRVTTRRRKSGFVKAVKAIAIKSMETKSYYYNIATTSLLHMSLVSYNLNYYISQGTSDQTRIGDEVYMRGVSVRLWFTDTVASGTHRYTVMVIRAKADIFATSLAYTDVFKSITADSMTDPIDTEKVTVLGKREIAIENKIASGSLARSVRFWVNMKNSRFKYSGDNAGYGKTYNYFLVVVPYANKGTIGTTAAGDVKGHAQIYFKDG